MTVYFITRHTGARDWLHKMHPDLARNSQMIAHADRHFFRRLREGDIVIGVLPVYLIAKVCETGARYFALTIPDMPPEKRGVELSASELETYGARLNEYFVLEGEALARLRDKLNGGGDDE